jgi:exodeoxyribonuclease VII small subunit
MTTNKKEKSFEHAFKRLEEILEKLNGGAVGLDESLTLYEEANSLIVQCTGKLNEAEHRVETLMKNRQGQLQMDGSGKPLAEPLDAQ